MAYNLELAGLINQLGPKLKKLEPRKMFGGIVFMLDAKMCFGIWKDTLIVRVGEEKARELIREPYAKIFDITGKPMRKWVMISQTAWKDKRQLERLIDLAIEFVATLPEGPAPKGRRKSKL